MNLKEIIGYFSSSADQSSHEFMRLWNLAVWGIKTEFNLDITGVYRTVVLDVNPNKTVNLPCDYISYSKLGLINSVGEIATFKRNSQLSTLNSGNLKNRLSNAPKTNGGPLQNPFNYAYQNSYYNFYDNGVMYNLYGANSGTANIGEYKIDEKSKLIYLNPTSTHSQIVLEYLCDGFADECCIIEIDVRAAQCMQSYIRWQNAVDATKKFSSNDVGKLRKEFYRTKRLAKMRLNPFVLNEMQSASRESTKLVAKA